MIAVRWYGSGKTPALNLTILDLSDIYKEKYRYIMNEKQKRLYDYLIRHKLGAFNSIANGRWTDDMRGMDMKDEAAAAGRYIDDVANEGVREMWRNGVDGDVASLSRAEIRKVAEAAYLYALEKKKWRMTCSRDRIDKIISEAMDRVINAKENKV